MRRAGWKSETSPSVREMIHANHERDLPDAHSFTQPQVFWGAVLPFAFGYGLCCTTCGIDLLTAYAAILFNYSPTANAWAYTVGSVLGAVAYGIILRRNRAAEGYRRSHYAVAGFAAIAGSTLCALFVKAIGLG